MRRATALLALSLVFLSVAFGSAQAAQPPPPLKGLSVTPARAALSVDAGQQKSGKLTVANLTLEPMTVQLSVKQFSVSDYVYDYRFYDPQNDWLHLETPTLTLQPGERRAVNYTLAVPAGTAPGGHYYTLFASTMLASGNLRSTVQAGVVLYATVNGQLKQTSQLRAVHLSRVTMSSHIGYTLDVLNTGNVHYFVYVSGRLRGLSSRGAGDQTTHLLLPAAVRRITGTMPAPILPGIYHATVGYRLDSGAPGQQVTQLVVYVPPWSLAALVLLGLAVWQWRARRKSSPKTASQKTDH